MKIILNLCLAIILSSPKSLYAGNFPLKSAPRSGFNSLNISERRNNIDSKIIIGLRHYLSYIYNDESISIDHAQSEIIQSLYNMTNTVPQHEKDSAGSADTLVEKLHRHSESEYSNTVWDVQIARQVNYFCENILVKSLDNSEQMEINVLNKITRILDKSDNLISKIKISHDRKMLRTWKSILRRISCSRIDPKIALLNIIRSNGEYFEFKNLEFFLHQLLIKIDVLTQGAKYYRPDSAESDRDSYESAPITTTSNLIIDLIEGLARDGYDISLPRATFSIKRSYLTPRSDSKNSFEYKSQLSDSNEQKPDEGESDGSSLHCRSWSYESTESVRSSF